MYAEGEYDLAGFCVGAVERDKLLDGASVRSGDVILGLRSSGVHSNGFSLVRKIVETADLPWDAPAPFETDKSLGEALLTPTRIYVRSCLAALEVGGVKALAHITGGGLPENLPRVLPAGTSAHLDAGAWSPPAVFQWLAKTGGVAPQEMLRTFNCGIGMAVIVDPEQAEALTALFADQGEEASVIGEIVEDSDGERVQIDKLDSLFSA